MDMKSLIVAIDFSEGTQRILAAAARMAKALHQRVYLVHVVDDTPLYTMYGMHPEEIPAMGEYRDLARQKAAAKLAEARDLLGSDVADVHGEVLEGLPQDAVIDFAQKVDAEMVIVGTHGHSAIGSVLMGSVASGLVRRAKVPVLVIPCQE